MQITYKGKEVDDPYLSVVRIKNDGNIAIGKEEIISQLSLKTLEKAHFIDAKINEKYPENLKVRIQLFSDSIIIEPDLLNPDDVMEFEILTEGGQPNLYLNGRIIGVKNFEKIQDKKNDVPYFEVIFILFVIICSMVVLSFIYPQLMSSRLTGSKKITLNKMIIYIIVTILFLVKVEAFITFVELIGLGPEGFLILYPFLNGIISLPIMSRLMRKEQIKLMNSGKNYSKLKRRKNSRGK